MAIVPDSHTFVDGLATSSEANTYIRDPVRFLLNRPYFQLLQIASQTLTTGVTTAITFTSEVFDDDPSHNSGHDNSTNNTRWTCSYPGVYLLGGGIAFNSNATGIRYAWLRINGSDVTGSLGQLTPTASDVNVCPTRPNFMAFLNFGDYVELVGNQTSGGNLATYVATPLWQSTLSGLWVHN